MNHVPIAVGLVLCDLVIVDKKTTNVTPVNCFSAKKLNDVPTSVDFHLVAWLNDGLGEMAVAVVVARMDTLDEVFRVEARLKFDNPLNTKRFFAHIQNCPIPIAGNYVVSLIVGGETVAERKFRAYV